MGMTALFSNALPAAPHHTSHPTAHNRRKGRRHRLNVPATLTPEGGGEPLHVRVVELSVGGLGMSAVVMTEVGKIYVVTAFDSLLPPGLRVRTVSQRTVNNGHFVGAAIL